jgi:hypothetical protein
MAKQPLVSAYIALISFRAFSLTSFSISKAKNDAARFQQ